MKKVLVTGAAGIIGSLVVSELGLSFRPMEDSLRDSIAWFREKGYA